MTFFNRTLFLLLGILFLTQLLWSNERVFRNLTVGNTTDECADLASDYDLDFSERSGLAIQYSASQVGVDMKYLENVTGSGTLRVTNSFDGGIGSLRSVVALASSGDTICFDDSLNGIVLPIVS